jgi:hypothetical protein
MHVLFDTKEDISKHGIHIHYQQVIIITIAIATKSAQGHGSNTKITLNT